MKIGKYIKILSKMNLKQKVALLCGKDKWSTAPIESLNIQSMGVTDGPHGVRCDQSEPGRLYSPATSFPTGSAMGACWNQGLIYRVPGPWPRRQRKVRIVTRQEA
jgi:beta-glucosidase